MTIHQNFIAGEWTSGGDAAKDINPSDLADTVGEYARASVKDAEAAIAAAKAAGPAWARSTPQARYDVLMKIGTEILARKDELGRLLSREEGKPLADGIGEVTPRRADIHLLRRRSGAAFRREAGLDPGPASTWKSPASPWASSP